ncbi:hypothetical protein F7734_60255 [Scytonema sp. UIC 10036]|uniref:hypothetical protein n=1 Tax=Scytonema sp. UIC 10036 TaxID=2304196 RepID=UPI0012DAAD2A|nr:hypothetical protein [Scytonema sp. UIC 10036]MUH01857.1 hypothetical protein [Scytonema sp. UIC 10036]
MNIQQWFPVIKWWVWIAITLSFPIGAGGWGLVQLFQLPELPDCLSESSRASASAVFYCGKAIADEQDVDKLSQAIELVSKLPASHPQYKMAEHLMEQWSQAVLRLGENAFQQGDIDRAVDIVKNIPDNVPTYKLVDNRIKQWRSVWSKASVIYEDAVAKLEKDDRENSYIALTEARKLLKIGNDYWETTKYQELVAQIQDIREKQEEQAAEEEKYRQAIAKQEPEKIDNWEQEQEAQDVAYLTRARNLAKSQKVEEMIDGISEASMVSYGRYYEEAQKLIAELRQNIEIVDDRSSLEQAKKLANRNDLISLQMAINEASLITEGRPLYKEANEHIAKWNAKVLKLQSQTQPNHITAGSEQLSVNGEQ